MTESSHTYTQADDLLPIGDVAKLLGVSIGTVRRWDASGHITSIRTPGGQRRFLRADVIALRSAPAS